MNYRYTFVLSVCVVCPFMHAADGAHTPLSAASISLPGTPSLEAPLIAMAPQQQDINADAGVCHACGRIASGIDNLCARCWAVIGEDDCCDDRGCCRSFYVCADCLERNKERFPASWLVCYGCIGSVCACGFSAADNARAAAALDAAGINSDGPVGNGWPCNTEICGNTADYHCTGRIVKTHCSICAVGAAMVTIVALSCVGCF